MAETAPVPITLAYAKSQLGDVLEKLEDARVASNVSGQGNTWTPQAISSLQSERDYWLSQVQALTASGAGAKNPSIAVAVWS